MKIHDADRIAGVGIAASLDALLVLAELELADLHISGWLGCGVPTLVESKILAVLHLEEVAFAWRSLVV